MVSVAPGSACWIPGNGAHSFIGKTTNKGGWNIGRQMVIELDDGKIYRS